MRPMPRAGFSDTVSVATAVATRLPRPSLTTLGLFSKHAKVGVAVIPATIKIDLLCIVVL